MVDQAENEVLAKVENLVTVSKDDDLNFENVFSEDSVPAILPNKPLFIDREKQFEAVKKVFATYADVEASDYPDNIARKLRLYGVIVSGREDIIRLCDALDVYFEVEENDRLFTFYWRGRRAVDIANLKKPKKVVSLAVGAFLLVTSFLLFLFPTRSDSKRIDVISNINTPVKEIASTATTEKPNQLLVANSATADEKIVEQIELLIQDGAFLPALLMLRDSLSPLNAESAKTIKTRIERLVIIKSDSLTKVIESLVAKGEHQEAFDLQQRFDKDVFRLAGTNVAKELRSRLLTDWVHSYKGSKSKEEAMAIVTNQVRGLLKNSSYVVASNSNGRMYLEYY